MKVLLVGDAAHQFLQNYAGKLISTGQFEQIDIFSTSGERIEAKNNFHQVFQINRGVPLFLTLTKLPVVRRFYRLLRRSYRFLLYRNLRSKLGEYDVVHAHYLDVDTLFIASLFKGARAVFTIWGSDYYKANPARLRGIYKSALSAHKISFTNVATMRDFKKRFKWTRENLYVCRFGLAPLEQLVLLNEEKYQSKEKLGWDNKKLSVAIGYNLSEGQQHILILEQLGRLTEYSEDIELILPITYGGSLEYKRKIIDKLDQLPFSYKVYDVFLRDKEIARLRNACDLMIQLQKTDQFSGSMQEHMFANNLVITGSWLPYETMKEFGVNFVELDDLSNLAETFDVVLQNFGKYQWEARNNPAAVLQLCSWESNIPGWLELYSESTNTL